MLQLESSQYARNSCSQFTPQWTALYAIHNVQVYITYKHGIYTTSAMLEFGNWPITQTQVATYVGR